MSEELYMMERDGEVRLIRKKEVYRWIFYHPVKSIREFLKAFKEAYRREFGGHE